MRQRKSRTQKETFNGERKGEKGETAEERERSRSNRGKKSVCEILRPIVDETSTRGRREPRRITLFYSVEDRRGGGDAECIR